MELPPIFAPEQPNETPEDGEPDAFARFDRQTARLENQLNREIERIAEERQFRLQFEFAQGALQSAARELTNIIREAVTLGWGDGIQESRGPLGNLAASIAQSAATAAAQNVAQDAVALQERLRSELAQDLGTLDVIGFAGTQNLIAGTVTNSTSTQLLNAVQRQLEELRESNRIGEDVRTLLEAIRDGAQIRFN